MAFDKKRQAPLGNFLSPPQSSQRLSGEAVRKSPEETIVIEFDMAGRTYQIRMKKTLATAHGFGNYWTQMVTEETDLLTGQQIIVTWSHIGVIRLIDQPPAAQRLGQGAQRATRPS